MNEIEKTRIAAAINQLRPDWPAASLRSLLDRPTISERPRRDVAVALAWVACESTSATPARVLESGPWWQAVAVEGDTTGRREPYDPTIACDVCSKPQHRHTVLDEHSYESVVAANRRRASQQPKTSIRAEETA
ncbi:MAG: hypothetical protein FWD95_01875 [Nocardioidaceae bacterium]|nr:hypothetical protein [Nocardioidaceae bacterium]